ncbi:hypothetical protein ES707_13044 [subsurface metagenome]
MVNVLPFRDFFFFLEVSGNSLLNISSNLAFSNWAMVKVILCILKRDTGFPKCIIDFFNASGVICSFDDNIFSSKDIDSSHNFFRLILNKRRLLFSRFNVYPPLFFGGRAIPTTLLRGVFELTDLSIRVSIVLTCLTLSILNRAFNKALNLSFSSSTPCKSSRMKFFSDESPSISE